MEYARIGSKKLIMNVNSVKEDTLNNILLVAQKKNVNVRVGTLVKRKNPSKINYESPIKC